MIHNRERKFDTTKLSAEQADSLSEQIGEKIKEINDKAVQEVNRILGIYGMEAKMQIVIGELGTLNKEPAKVSAKVPRKPRVRKSKSNL